MNLQAVIWLVISILDLISLAYAAIGAEYRSNRWGWVAVDAVLLVFAMTMFVNYAMM